MKIRLIELFFLLASLFLIAFSSRHINNYDDLESGTDFDFDLNDFEADENDNDNAVVGVNDMFINDYEYLRPVPRVQFDNAFRISLTIFSISKFMDSESFIYKLLGIALASTLPIQLQQYFGYGFKLAWPLKYERMIQYEHGGNFVSFNRWFLTPFLWFTEFLLLLSEEDFKNLNLPERNIFYFLFVIQLIHYCGIIDLFISFLTGPKSDKNK